MNIIYLNGSYLQKSEAKIGIEDTGFIFADGLYEVFLVNNSKLIDFEPHINRLQNGLEFMKIEFDTKNIENITKTLLQKNAKENALVYFQITRGNMGERKHGLPKSSNPTVVGMLLGTRSTMHLPPAKCITESDSRWQRRDIKTIGLLPNVIAKQKAIDLGFDDAIFIDGSIVTEATSSNVLIVKNGKIFTHPATNKILNGITKQRIEIFAKECDISFVHKCFTEDDMLNADEVMLTSAGSLIRIVGQINNCKIGSGRFPIFELMRRQMENFIS